jgi:hypothetical protein
MKIIYAQQPLEKYIFLVGPSPRKNLARPPAPSWRPRALGILDTLAFKGTVLVPELRSPDAPDEYDRQIPWEWEGLNLATVAPVWVDRDLVDMPGFTTNIEAGMLAASGKMLLGFPEGAPKTVYLAKLAKRFNVPVFHTMEELLAEAVRRTRLPFGDYD